MRLLAVILGSQQHSPPGRTRAPACVPSLRQAWRRRADGLAERSNTEIAAPTLPGPEPNRVFQSCPCCSRKKAPNAPKPGDNLLLRLHGHDVPTPTRDRRFAGRFGGATYGPPRISPALRGIDSSLVLNPTKQRLRSCARSPTRQSETYFAQ
jgi:hypothetical protein